MYYTRRVNTYKYNCNASERVTLIITISMVPLMFHSYSDNIQIVKLKGSIRCYYKYYVIILI